MKNTITQNNTVSIGTKSTKEKMTRYTYIEIAGRGFCNETSICKIDSRKKAQEIVDKFTNPHRWARIIPSSDKRVREDNKRYWECPKIGIVDEAEYLEFTQR